MVTLTESIPIILEPTEKKILEIKSVLKKSNIKNVAIINIHCMNTEFPRIKELLGDSNRLKIFHGGTKNIFNNIIKTFNLQDRIDIKYTQQLKVSEIVIYYWNYKFENILPMVSRREGSLNEEI